MWVLTHPYPTHMYTNGDSQLFKRTQKRMIILTKFFTVILILNVLKTGKSSSLKCDIELRLSHPEPFSSMVAQ